MNFPYNHYNWFSGQSTNNRDYAEALALRVESIYLNSWIAQYYNLTVNNKDGMVSLIDNNTNKPSLNDRFNIFLQIPDETKKYFMPKSEWSLYGIENSPFIETKAISHIKHAFSAKAYPYDMSSLYLNPFFIIFKTNANIHNNFFKFSDYHHPSKDIAVLSMIDYNETTEQFEEKFSPGLIIPFENNRFVLNSILEFECVDSNNQPIQVKDGSRLFIAIYRN